MVVMAADEFMCVVCGIAGGELYVDSDHETAQLSVSYRTTRLPDGRTGHQYVTECKRCKVGSTPETISDLPRRHRRHRLPRSPGSARSRFLD